MFGTIVAGVPITLLLTVSGVLIGALGGIPLVLARTSQNWIGRAFARSFIEIFRGIPPIVWLFIIFFGVGNYVPGLSPLAASIIGLGLISCAYLAEIYRGGLAAVGPGQREAAEALGMSRSRIISDVIGPQVLRVSIPAAATYAIGLLKDSSVAYTIGVSEVMYFANRESKTASDAIGPFLIAAAIYILMTVPCAWAARALDSRFRKAVVR